MGLHASCKRATLAITHLDPGSIQLSVSDAGVGFDPESQKDLSCAGFGLCGIREQAALLGGTLAVTSSPRRGTRVVVTVPLGK